MFRGAKKTEAEPTKPKKTATLTQLLTKDGKTVTQQTNATNSNIVDLLGFSTEPTVDQMDNQVYKDLQFSKQQQQQQATGEVKKEEKKKVYDVTEVSDESDDDVVVIGGKKQIGKEAFIDIDDE